GTEPDETCDPEAGASCFGQVEAEHHPGLRELDEIVEPGGSREDPELHPPEILMHDAAFRFEEGADGVHEGGSGPVLAEGRPGAGVIGLLVVACLHTSEEGLPDAFRLP